MSHFSRIKTQLSDKDLLIQALKALGFTPEEGHLLLQGFGGQHTPVEILIRLPRSFPIGFRKNGAFFEIVADWSGVRGIQAEEFTQHLLQRYAYLATRQKLEAQGFTLIEEQVASTGEIRLLLRRMV